MALLLPTDRGGIGKGIARIVKDARAGSEDDLIGGGDLGQAAEAAQAVAAAIAAGNACSGEGTNELAIAIQQEVAGIHTDDGFAELDKEGIDGGATRAGNTGKIGYGGDRIDSDIEGSGDAALVARCVGGDRGEVIDTASQG